ncbi:MAG: hydrogenase maturation protease [Chloroflexota bacterium]
MTGPTGFPLVLGVGNILLQDEGVGIAVARSISEDEAGLPPGTRVVDGGTLGLDLLPLIGDAGAMVMVDAVDLGREPGAIAVIRDDDIHGVLAGHVSPHQVGIGDLIAAARLMGTLPRHVSLVGIQPGTIAIGLELTAAVAAAVPLAADAVRRELALVGAD